MPDTPERQRDETRKSIVTLLIELTNDIRQWVTAELSLARIELDDLKKRLITVAICAGLAVALCLTALIVLVNAGVDALAIYLGSEALAGLIVGVVLLAIAGICIFVMKKNLAWKADSLLFGWLTGSGRNRRTDG